MPSELLDFEERHARGDQARAKRVATVAVVKRRPQLRSLDGLLKPPPAIARAFVAFRRDVFTPRTLSQARQAPVRGTVDSHCAGPGFSRYIQNTFPSPPILPPRIPLFRA